MAKTQALSYSRFLGAIMSNHMRISLRQFSYLFIVSFTSLGVWFEWAQPFQVNAWIIPNEFGYHWLLRGIVSDLLILLLPTGYLVLMAWLPKQLDGGMKVSFTLVAWPVFYQLVVSIRTVADKLSAPEGFNVLSLLYDLRSAVLFIVLPFLLVESARRMLKTHHFERP